MWIFPARFQSTHRSGLSLPTAKAAAPKRETGNACLSLCRFLTKKIQLPIHLPVSPRPRIQRGESGLPWCNLSTYHGAGGGTRTHTVSPPADFESATSTNSITPACDGIDYSISSFKIQERFLKVKEVLFLRSPGNLSPSPARLCFKII